MALFAKDPNDIIQQAIDFLTQNTSLNSTTPGTKLRALVEIMQRLTSDAYTIFDFNVAIGFVYGANGKYLDYLGDMLGLKRRTASTADVLEGHRAVKFYSLDGSFGTINNNSDIVIPSGTEVWAEQNGTQIKFLTESEIVLPKNDSEKYISVKALQPGSISNVAAGAIRYHNFNSYTDFKRGVLRIANLDSISNGQDAESDDNYRFRIINNKLSRASANETAIRMAALGIPGVADVKISDRYYGAGTAYVFVKSTTPILSESILARVQEAIDEAKAGGFNVKAIGPNYNFVEFTVSVAFKDRTSSDEIEQAREAIKTAIISYVNNLDIAEALVVNQLANLAVNAHPKIKSIGKPGKYFDKITILKPIIDRYIRYDSVGDYQPGENTKLVISSNAVTIR